MSDHAAVPPVLPLRVFICYRRADAPAHAGRLYDRLRAHFGEQNVFMDVERIGAGEDFVRTIRSEIPSCDVLIVVIGKEWMAATRRAARSDSDTDYVGQEISAALEEGVRLIPVLMEGTTMPAAKRLPAQLKPIVRRNAVTVRDGHWRQDVDQLVAEIEKIVPGSRVDPEPVVVPGARHADGRLRRWLLPAGVAVLAVLGLLKFSPVSPFQDNTQTVERTPRLQALLDSIQVIPTSQINTFVNSQIVARMVDEVIMDHTGAALPAAGYRGKQSIASMFWFAQERGFRNVGWHFAIAPDGTVWQGRPLYEVGAHTRGRNETSIGVLWILDGDVEQPSHAQMASTAVLLRALFERFKIDPAENFGPSRGFNSDYRPGSTGPGSAIRKDMILRAIQ